MAQSKKKSRVKVYEEIPKRYFSKLENYDESVKQEYELLKIACRVEIAPNIELVKLIPFGKGMNPLLSLDIKARYPGKEYTYRHPLNFTSLEQFNIIKNALLSNPEIEKYISSVDKLDTEIVKTNTELYNVKKAKKEAKKLKEGKDNEKEGKEEEEL